MICPKCGHDLSADEEPVAEAGLMPEIDVVIREPEQLPDKPMRLEIEVG